MSIPTRPPRFALAVLFMTASVVAPRTIARSASPDDTAVAPAHDAAKGDALNIDHSLRGALTETESNGSTRLSFGAGHSILLQGVSDYSTSHIHWI